MRHSGRLRARGVSRLLLFDIIILRNGFVAAFASLRDRILLAVILTLFGAWIANSARSGASQWEWPLVAAGALMLGASVQARLARRLDDFVTDSPLAADALEAASRHRYTAAWHLIAITAAILFALLIGQPRLALALPAYAIGALLAVLWRTIPRPQFMHRARTATRPSTPTASLKPQSAWAAMTSSVAQRQIGVASRSIPLFAILGGTAAVATIIAAMLQFATTPLAAEAVFALTAIGLAVRLSRVDHEIVTFISFAGFGPWASVAPHAAASAITGMCMVGSASLLGSRFALLASLIFAGGLIILTLRVLAYRLYPKRQADLALTLALGAAGLIGSGAPFLLPPMLVLFILVLAWRARSTTWLAP